jgi:hypothetical protein
MTAMDIRAGATAERLIAKYGKVFTYTRLVVSTYDPATGRQAAPASTAYTLKGLVGTLRSKGGAGVGGDGFAPGTEIYQTDRTVTLAAGDITFVPTAGDRLSIDAVVFTVMKTKPVYSGELVALWELECKK